jgi:hypothetical protein
MEFYYFPRCLRCGFEWQVWLVAGDPDVYDEGDILADGDECPKCNGNEITIDKTAWL